MVELEFIYLAILSNSINSQLNLSIPGCDDLWLELEMKPTFDKQNKKMNHKTLVIGCVYR